MPVTIFSRYFGLATIEADGRISLAQRPAVSAQTQPGSLHHILIGNETLDQLAAYYYGRADLWWRIADANPLKFPLDWKPGEVLVIPPIQTATRTPRG